MKSFSNTLRLIFGIFTVIMFFGPYSILILPVFAVIRIFSKSACERLILKHIRRALRIVQFIAGIRPEIIGLENIPKEPVLFISNHRSYFDIIISYPAVPGRLGFIAKQEFKKLLTMGIWMTFGGCLFLNRKNPREGLKTILSAADAIKDGRSMWICPEGTRNHGEGLLPFKEGSYKIAEKSGAPIVPVAIVNSDAVYETAPKGQLVPCKVYVVFGKPITTKGLGKDELREVHDRVYNEILSMYTEYKAKLEAGN